MLFYEFDGKLQFKILECTKSKDSKSFVSGFNRDWMVLSISPRHTFVYAGNFYKLAVLLAAL
tara:strand:+ start:619 stop:804 length:186 start_codon:yes stop_codon:yes gene_type:complete